MQQFTIGKIETMLKTVNLNHIAVQIEDILNQAINHSHHPMKSSWKNY